MDADKIHVMPIPNHQWKAPGEDTPDKIVVYCAFPSSNDFVEAARLISLFFNLNLTGAYAGSATPWHQNLIRQRQDDYEGP
jgi:hypothetical protein